ncbi:unnamed protein product, partial [Pylaiella littoralis]
MLSFATRTLRPWCGKAFAPPRGIGAASRHVTTRPVLSELFETAESRPTNNGSTWPGHLLMATRFQPTTAREQSSCFVS